MHISEIYASIQGEGEYTGTPSVFVRTTGCNLRCWFCDTPFTSWEPTGTHHSVDAVLAEVNQFNEEHIVITGGEPLLQPEVVTLCEALEASGRFVTVETAGTVFRPAPARLMSVSPKLHNSTPSAERSAYWARQHEDVRHQPQVIRQLLDGYTCQFKFVIDQPDDVTEVCQYLEEFPEIDHSRVWLMPQAITREELSEKSDWIADAAAAAGFQFSSRWQIEQYGNVRGR